MTEVPIKEPCPACTNGKNEQGSLCAKCGGTSKLNSTVPMQDLVEKVAKLLKDSGGS